MIIELCYYDHSLGSRYIDSIKVEYLFLITSRFNFNVGVNSPPSILKSPSIRLNFETFAAFEIAVLLTYSNNFVISPLSFVSFTASLTDFKCPNPNEFNTA